MGDNFVRSYRSGSLNGGAALNNSLDMNVIFRIGLVNLLALENFFLL